MLAAVRVSPPSEKPVSLVEAKKHLLRDDSDQDDLIGALIQAATDHFDGMSGILGRALVTQTWRLDVADGCDKLRLPLAPVASISSVKYWDDDNVDTTWDVANYRLYEDKLGPYIALASNASWPSVYDRPDALRVEFVAGYGPAADVPAPLKIAILWLVAHMFRHREAVVIGDAASPLPYSVESLIGPYKRWTF